MECGVCYQPMISYSVMCKQDHKLCLDCSYCLLKTQLASTTYQGIVCPFCRDNVKFVQQPDSVTALSRQIYCQSVEYPQRGMMLLLCDGDNEYPDQVAVKLFSCNQHIKHLKKQTAWELYDKFLSQVIQRDINEKRLSQFSSLEQFMTSQTICNSPLPIDKNRSIIYRFLSSPLGWVLCVKIMSQDLCDAQCRSRIKFRAREL